jgi:SAM-dependent methyltransferase
MTDAGTRTDSLLSFECDQYQRYALLRRLVFATHAARRERGQEVRVLDVGSGPERLTETFLGDGFFVTRCDVESFGDESIVVVNPDEPLPFAEAEFDVVVALEVLEHVHPAARAQFIRECLRVARDLVVLTCPDGRTEVAGAERRISSVFELLTGRPHPFLQEHAEYGLPQEEEVRKLLDATGVPYLVAGNSRLDRWEGFLLLDQFLRTTDRGPEVASEIYRRANSSFPLRSDENPYRKFYVAWMARLDAAVREGLSEPLPDAAADLADSSFQLARLAAAELSAREIGRIDAEAQIENLDTRRAKAEQRTRSLEARLGSELEASERRVGELEADLEALTYGVVAATTRDEPRIVSIGKQLAARPWTNHGYAAEARGEARNIQVSGHSFWCFSGAGSLTLRSTFQPGTYRLHAHVASSGAAQLSVETKGGVLGEVPIHRGFDRLSDRISLRDEQGEITLSLETTRSPVVLVDVQILRRLEEPVTASVRRNMFTLARRRAALRRLGRTQLGRAAASRLKPPPLLAVETTDYEEWIRQRLDERRRLYPQARRTIPLSVLTPAWNTPVPYLEALGESILGQTYRDFEWILIDNGSTDPATIACVTALGKRDRVRLERTEQQHGIIGGLRRCLERASGQYVLVADHDDRLYRDALQVFANSVLRAGSPKLAYSDEDKLFGDRFLDAYLKPDWDPVLFLNSCYIAHLIALDRARALELGVYTDSAAEGCHDWDAFMRFMLAGHRPLHVSEVLYSWRMHPRSTALNIGSKSYIEASHIHVLQKFLDAQSRPGLFSLRRSPLWGGTPDWWFQRKRQEGRPVLTARVGRSGLELSAGAAALKPLAERAGADGGVLIHIIWSEITFDEEGAWDALGLFELHPDTAVVGGRVLDKERRVVAAGEYFGFGGICAAPDIGRAEHDPGYFGQMWKQRSVSAVSTMNAVVEASFLLESLRALDGEPVSIPFLGAWLGATAALAGRRVVYTPFLAGTTHASRAEWEQSITNEEHRAFAKRFAALLPETRYISRLLSLDPARPYAPSSEEERDEALSRFGVGQVAREPLIAKRP